MKNNDIKRSMDDVTKDKIVLVDAKGNTLGEVERAPKKEEQEPAKKKTKKKPNKKERRRRKRRAIIAVIVEIVLGLAILVIGGGLFAFICCSVEDVEVEGNNIYTPEEIEELVIDGKYKDNCVYNVVNNFVKPKKNIPFVDKVKVTMTSLNTNKITVTERIPFGYVAPENEDAKYFNEDGIITDISDKKLDNSTIWLDVTASGSEVGDKIVDDDVMLSSYLETAKGLKANNIFVNSIKIDDNHNIYATKDGIKINFGLKNDMDDKCKRLSIILPQLDNQQGTLHLENFSKENTDIVFKRE